MIVVQPLEHDAHAKRPEQVLLGGSTGAAAMPWAKESDCITEAKSHHTQPCCAFDVRIRMARKNRKMIERRMEKRYVGKDGPGLFINKDKA